jgi:peptidoglycan/LPS O-acetylase OafA/YrhL
VIDLMKVLAAQVILWHHFCRYGPMANTLHEQGQDWVAWLAQNGRYAVQVFLVISGFLAMQRVKHWLAEGALSQVLIRASVRRCWRIAVPYWWMLVAALLAAWLARAILFSPDTPAQPALAQVLAHALFLQDMLGQPAISTGVWYVAIDLQLHLGFTGLALALGGAMRSTVFGHASWDTWLGLCAGLFVFNLDAKLDIWAPCFFGPFCLGALMAWSAGLGHGLRGLSWLLLLLVCLGALVVQWRIEVFVAIGAGLMLMWSGVPVSRRVIWTKLSHQSYCLFLFHYPVILVVGSMIEALFPGEVAAAALGMACAWCVAMVLAAWVTSRLEPAIRG